MASRKSLPLLTRAESEIMRVLWQRGEATVHEVVEAAPRTLAYTTVLTMLRVLEQKGYAARATSPADGSRGRAHVYRAAVSEEGARRSHLRDFVDRLFGGRAEELVMGLVQDEPLTRGELEQLRDAIDAKLASQGAHGKRGKR